jgi:hypothetical protein
MVEHSEQNQKLNNRNLAKNQIANESQIQLL